jgi:hypothetical protein
VRPSVAAHSETPAESGSKTDLCALGVQDLEVGRAREPAFEAPCDLLAPGADLGSSRQEQARVDVWCQALGESSEVAHRKSGEERVWSGFVRHLTQGIRTAFGRHQPFGRSSFNRVDPEGIRTSSLFLMLADAAREADETNWSGGRALFELCGRVGTRRTRTHSEIPPELLDTSLATSWVRRQLHKPEN